MTPLQPDSMTSKATSKTSLSSATLPINSPRLHATPPKALIGRLNLQIEEHIREQIAKNEGVRSSFTIGPDATTRNVVYFFPEHEFLRSYHPFSYRMRAFYHPIEHIPRHSQVWTIHTRVEWPYNVDIYVVEDLTGEYPRRHPSPPKQQQPERKNRIYCDLPDLRTAPGDANRVHYLPLLRDAREGVPPENVVVHVPPLRPDEANRVYRFYLYPWSGARRSGGGGGGGNGSSIHSRYLQYYVGHHHLEKRGAYPEMPRCAVIAPASAGGTVAHGADGLVVGPLTRAYCEEMGSVADWIEACVRAGAAGYDASDMPAPVDEESEDDWGPLLGAAPAMGAVGSRSVSDLTMVEEKEEEEDDDDDEEEPFYLDLLFASRERSADVCDARSFNLSRLFALTRGEWREVVEDAWEDEEAYGLGLLFDPREETKDLDDEDSFNLRRLFEEPEEDEELNEVEKVFWDGVYDEVYQADDEFSDDEPIAKHFWFALD
ncbi:hypothetical protein JOL62DRAFT_553960 [Phyllosticta paracitricarpa]|uniref:Uncharacterized protein n=1 Tax=Phyllosticta paracitricarpa TaxID=2016321 RepID=A0ABR1NFY1_9PEZI